jgi:ATP-dependent DNA helicase RecG
VTRQEEINGAKNSLRQQSILLTPISKLPRIGPVLTKFLSRLIGGDRLFDLLLHAPIRAEKISFCPRLFETQNGELVIIKAKVESHIKPANARQPYKVICYTPSGYVNLVFFKIFPSQITKMPIGSEISVLGHLQRFSGENNISHPQEILPIAEIEKMPHLNVIYPLGAAISQKFLRQKIEEVLRKITQENEEVIDERLLTKQGWPRFDEALKNLHFFGNNLEEKKNLARQRLAYDELLAWQIAALLAKQKTKPTKNFTPTSKNLAQDFLTSLPFKPTTAQLQAISEISAEIFSNKKMLRLLQGDVGSGKTVVAIAACLGAISKNQQACVIAPTTTLTKQHFAYFQRFLQHFEISLEILTSATTKKQKSKILEKLFTGEIQLLISTHAVLEDDVKFKNLGLAVIDEQHRFGVLQRLKLVEKSNDVDVLLMSATPIPRSLMMGLYGDMEISILGEKPQNRQEIETLILSQKKSAEVHAAMKRALARGEKIYWICPIIEPSEIDETLPSKERPDLELAAVTDKFDELTEIFDEKTVGLIHGKMKEEQKEKVMAEFSKSDGGLKILVATTVIEVGIDVPDATIIIIENAENFGLSQLHQLRGRVGRSDKKSFCILLYGKKFGQNARQRLDILRRSNDGFFIAEEDLKMRGSGELLGTKQSGFPEFCIANLETDGDLLKIARKNAEVILLKDKNLEMPSSQKYQALLKLFRYDEFLNLVESG